MTVSLKKLDICESERIKGLSIFPEFIGERTEEELLRRIGKADPVKLAGRNRIMRYGSDLPYQNDVVSFRIPDWLETVGELVYYSDLLPMQPDSITINEYYPGQIIPVHTDSEASGDVIAVLSLGSSCMMQFYRASVIKEVLLPARSLTQLKEDSRYLWQHGIQQILNYRVSIVFRCSRG